MSVLRRIADTVPPKVAVVLDGGVTAIAVAASLFASQFGWESGVAVVGLSFVASAAFTYTTQYTPLVRLRTETQRDLVQFALEDFERKYVSQITDCDIRANVMLKKRQFGPGIVPSRETYLTIEYGRDGYTNAEIEQEYDEGEGCAGICLEKSNPTYYGADDGQDERAVETLSATKREITADIDSILSVPVYPDNDTERAPVGVLNVDSTQGLSETEFDKEAAQTLAMKYAGVVGDIIS